MAGILAVVEQRDGALRRISEEVVSAAAQLGEKLGAEVHAWLAGPPGVAGAAGALGKNGAARIFVLEDAAFQQYHPDALGQAIADHIKQNSYDVVLFGGSSFGKDLALDAPLWRVRRLLSGRFALLLGRHGAACCHHFADLSSAAGAVSNCE